MAFDKFPGPVSSFPSCAAAPAFRFLLMSKRVTKAMSRIARSPPKTPLAIIAAGATFLELFSVEVAEPVGVEDANAACSDVFPLDDVLHEELHRLSLLGVVDSGGVPDFVTVMETGWEEEFVGVAEDTLTAKMG